MKVVAFPFHDWNKGEAEGFRTRDGHLMQEFARHPGVDELVVINRPISRVERLIRQGAQGQARATVHTSTLKRHAVVVRRVAPSILTVDIATPELVRPIVQRRGWWFSTFSSPTVIQLLERAVEACGAKRAPAITWLPAPVDALLALRPRRLVFDSLDNWLIHPALRRHRAAAERAYARLLPVADHVLVAAPRSAEALSRWRSDCEVVPNGVDSSVFGADAVRPADLPEGPVVGYAGKLAHRIDAELVSDVARSLPDVTFVFIGPVLDRGAIRPMSGIANVRLLGDRFYTAMPGYLRHFDVGWIPHRVGEGETGGDPIKLYEYWAAGLPVVSTRIDGMQAWDDVIALVDNADEASRAIRRMLESPMHAPVPPDREWSAIANRMVGYLQGGGT